MSFAVSTIKKGNTCFIALCVFSIAICLNSCTKPGKPVSSKVKIEFRLAESSPGENLDEFELDGKKIYLHKEVLLSNADIESAELAKTEYQTNAIDLTFNTDGATKLKEISSRNIDKKMAILVDGKILIAPVIRARLSNNVQISGDFTLEETIALFSKLTAK